MDIPSDLLYSNDHEWVKLDDEIATIGITDFAQRELGDIVYVEIENVGEVLEFNTELEDTPEAVNDEPYESGWMIKIKMDNPDQLKNLLSADQYKKLIQA